MLGHEVDRIGRGHLRGNNEIAFVLAVRVIDQNEHASVARVVDDLFDGREKLGVVLVIGRSGIGHRVAFTPKAASGRQHSAPRGRFPC